MIYGDGEVVGTIKIVVALMLLAACRPAVSAEPIAWRWHEKNVELYEATFSPKGDEIAVVRKLHFPDGHEAESVPEEVFKKLTGEILKNPRYGDPEIVVVKFGGDEASRVDWGWTPSFSPDGGLIAYAHQTNPASGKRLLAQTLAGNEIRVVVRATGETRTLARPVTGYFAVPTFSPDGQHVTYSIADAVNGAFGGGVGVGRVQVAGAGIETLYAPRRVHGLYELIGPPRYVGNRLLTIRSIPTGPGMYLARSYSMDLIDVAHGNAVVYSWGARESMRRTPIDFAPISGERVLVYDGVWFEPGGARAGKSETRNGPPGVPSPNGKLVAGPTGASLEVRERGGSKTIGSWELGGELRQVAWAQDSRRLVAVVTHYLEGEDEVFAFDELFGIDLR